MPASVAQPRHPMPPSPFQPSNDGFYVMGSQSSNQASSAGTIASLEQKLAGLEQQLAKEQSKLDEMSYVSTSVATQRLDGDYDDELDDINEEVQLSDTVQRLKDEIGTLKAEINKQRAPQPSSSIGSDEAQLESLKRTLSEKLKDISAMWGEEVTTAQQLNDAYLLADTVPQSERLYAEINELFVKVKALEHEVSTQKSPSKDRLPLPPSIRQSVVASVTQSPRVQVSSIPAMPVLARSAVIQPPVLARSGVIRPPPLPQLTASPRLPDTAPKISASVTPKRSPVHVSPSPLKKSRQLVHTSSVIPVNQSRSRVDVSLPINTANAKYKQAAEMFASGSDLSEVRFSLEFEEGRGSFLPFMRPNSSLILEKAYGILKRTEYMNDLSPDRVFMLDPKNVVDVFEKRLKFSESDNVDALVDVGCGLGWFSLAFALVYPKFTIYAVEQDRLLWLKATRFYIDVLASKDGVLMQAVNRIVLVHGVADKLGKLGTGPCQVMYSHAHATFAQNKYGTFISPAMSALRRGLKVKWLITGSALKTKHTENPGDEMDLVSGEENMQTNPVVFPIPPTELNMTQELQYVPGKSKPSQKLHVYKFRFKKLNEAYAKKVWDWSNLLLGNFVPDKKHAPSDFLLHPIQDYMNRPLLKPANETPDEYLDWLKAQWGISYLTPSRQEMEIQTSTFNAKAKQKPKSKNKVVDDDTITQSEKEGKTENDRIERALLDIVSQMQEALVEEKIQSRTSDISDEELYPIVTKYLEASLVPVHTFTERAMSNVNTDIIVTAAERYSAPHPNRGLMELVLNTVPEQMKLLQNGATMNLYLLNFMANLCDKYLSTLSVNQATTNALGLDPNANNIYGRVMGDLLELGYDDAGWWCIAAAFCRTPPPTIYGIDGSIERWMLLMQTQSLLLGNPTLAPYVRKVLFLCSTLGRIKALGANFGNVHSVIVHDHSLLASDVKLLKAMYNSHRDWKLANIVSFRVFPDDVIPTNFKPVSADAGDVFSHSILCGLTVHADKAKVNGILTGVIKDKPSPWDTVGYDMFIPRDMPSVHREAFAARYGDRNDAREALFQETVHLQRCNELFEHATNRARTHAYEKMRKILKKRIVKRMGEPSSGADLGSDVKYYWDKKWTRVEEQTTLERNIGVGPVIGLLKYLRHDERQALAKNISRPPNEYETQAQGQADTPRNDIIYRFDSAQRYDIESSDDDDSIQFDDSELSDEEDDVITRQQKAAKREEKIEQHRREKQRRELDQIAEMDIVEVPTSVPGEDADESGSDEDEEDAEEEEEEEEDLFFELSDEKGSKRKIVFGAGKHYTRKQHTYKDGRLYGPDNESTCYLCGQKDLYSDEPVEHEINQQLLLCDTCTVSVHGDCLLPTLEAYATVYSSAQDILLSIDMLEDWSCPWCDLDKMQRSKCIECNKGIMKQFDGMNSFVVCHCCEQNVIHPACRRGEEKGSVANNFVCNPCRRINQDCLICGKALRDDQIVLACVNCRGWCVHPMCRDDLPNIPPNDRRRNEYGFWHKECREDKKNGIDRELERRKALYAKLRDPNLSVESMNDILIQLDVLQTSGSEKKFEETHRMLRKERMKDKTEDANETTRTKFEGDITSQRAQLQTDALKLFVQLYVNRITSAHSPDDALQFASTKAVDFFINEDEKLIKAESLYNERRDLEFSNWRRRLNGVLEAAFGGDVAFRKRMDEIKTYCEQQEEKGKKRLAKRLKEREKVATQLREQFIGKKGQEQNKDSPPDFFVLAQLIHEKNTNPKSRKAILLELPSFKELEEQDNKIQKMSKEVKKAKEVLKHDQSEKAISTSVQLEKAKEMQEKEYDELLNVIAEKAFGHLAEQIAANKEEEEEEEAEF